MPRFSEVPVDEIEYVLVVTMDGGSLMDDIFYVVLTARRAWHFPATGGENDNVLNWLNSQVNVDWEQAITASVCLQYRSFLIWRRTGPPLLGEQTKSMLLKRLKNLLCSHVEVPADRVDGIVRALFADYRAPFRKYHDLRHILHCLWELDQLPNALRDRQPELELAIWYHDCVYSPQSKTNEVDSSTRLLNDLGSLPTNLDLGWVAQAIQASNHRRREASGDGALDLFLDIDLSVLGLPPVDYMVYAQNIRLEFAAVPSGLFEFYRQRLLNGLLEGPIFKTAHFQARYESSARTNVASELNRGPLRLIPA